MRKGTLKVQVVSVNYSTFEMFSLGNFNHIVKSVTHTFVKHLIYWKLYIISCSSGDSPALSTVAMALWVQQHAKAGSKPLLPKPHCCKNKQCLSKMGH